LKQQGFKIDTAVDGQQALEKIRVNKLNLVIPDTMLPKYMDTKL